MKRCGALPKRSGHDPDEGQKPDFRRNIVEAVRHIRTIVKEMRHLTILGKEELVHEAKNLGAPLDLVEWVAEHGKLPVPNFSAGGIATPADAKLWSCSLGPKPVFVGSGIFKSSDPEARARKPSSKPLLITKTRRNCSKPAKSSVWQWLDSTFSKLPEGELMQTRGW